jgi:hypothetical protein
MLDVHPPHEPVHGWRDFLLHLFTITIGLLIALSLEGLVEWQHHRHLVHEAEASLHEEIKGNAESIHAALADLKKQQANLSHDVVVLNKMIKKMPKDKLHDTMEITFHISGFEDVSWKTAQSTGALSFMPYDMAKQYSNLYSTQDAIYIAEQQAARDAILSLAPFTDTDESGPDPTPAEATDIKQKINILQGQLFLVEAIMTSLDKHYKEFLSAHP